MPPGEFPDPVRVNPFRPEADREPPEPLTRFRRSPPVNPPCIVSVAYDLHRSVLITIGTAVARALARSPSVAATGRRVPFTPGGSQ